MLFDGVIDKFSAICNMKDRLGPCGEIVENLCLEFDLVNVQKDVEFKLSPAKRRAIKHILRPTIETQTFWPVLEIVLAEEFLKQRKRIYYAEVSRYILAQNASLPLQIYMSACFPLLGSR